MPRDPIHMRLFSAFIFILFALRADAQSAAVGLDPDMILKPGESVSEKIRKKLFLRLEVDRTTAYVGQPISVAYKLYTCLNSESRVTRRPSFSGFSVIEAGEKEPDKPVDVLIDGTEFQVYTLRKVQLFPLRDGRFLLESIEVDNTIKFLRGDQLRDGGSMDEMIRLLDVDNTLPEDRWVSEKLTLSTEPLRVEIKPLPELSGNPHFKGAVGRFSLRTAVSPDSLQAGQSGIFTMIIEGSGNIPVMGIPDVAWPAGVEYFEPEIMEDYDTNHSGKSSRKVMKYPFSISDTGRCIFPPVMMSVFDPKAGSFSMIRSDSVSVHVLPAADDIQISEPDKSLTGGSNAGEMGKNLLRIFAMLIPAVVVIVVLWRKRGKRSDDRQHIEADQPMSGSFTDPFADERRPKIRTLEQSGILLRKGSVKEAYIGIEEVLRAELSERHGISLGETMGGMRDLLLSQGISLNAARDLVGFMQHCQEKIYAPFTDGQQAESDLVLAATWLTFLQASKKIG